MLKQKAHKLSRGRSGTVPYINQAFCLLLNKFEIITNTLKKYAFYRHQNRLIVHLLMGSVPNRPHRIFFIYSWNESKTHYNHDF